MKDFFDFAERQDKCTHVLGCKLTLHRESDNHVVSQLAGASDTASLALARGVIIGDISLYVPHYTPNISNQNLMLGHFVSKAATELSYIKSSSYVKEVTIDNNWTFELGVGDGIDIHIYVVVKLMQRDQFNQQHQGKDAFYRPSVINAHCIIGSENYTDAGKNCNYAIDNNSQAYGKIVSCFRHSAKDKILQPYITQEVFFNM